jgi:hypothetical protein
VFSSFWHWAKASFWPYYTSLFRFPKLLSSPDAAFRGFDVLLNAAFSVHLLKIVDSETSDFTLPLAPPAFRKYLSSFFSPNMACFDFTNLMTGAQHVMLRVGIPADGGAWFAVE